MPRSRIIFLVIIGAAILLVLGVQLAPRIIPAGPTATPLPALSIEIAVNPMAYDWAADQALKFNLQSPQAEGQPFQIKVTQQEGIDTWQAGPVWTPNRHPVGWLPESTFTVDYAKVNNLSYDVITTSLGSTSLVWGIFKQRADVLATLEAQPGKIDWDVIQQAVVKGAANGWSDLGGNAQWGYIKPAFALAQKSTSGFAVLLSAAAAYFKTDQLISKDLSDPAFRVWLAPVLDAVPRSPLLSQKPGTALAASGSSVADFGLLPESDWVVNYRQIASREQIQFSYPTYRLTFNFPMTVWSGPENTTAEKSAVKQFADFLGQSAAQARLLDYGLRPVQGTLTISSAPLFASASTAGIILDAPPGTFIAVPPRDNALTVLNWAKTIRLQ